MLPWYPLQLNASTKPTPFCPQYRTAPDRAAKHEMLYSWYNPRLVLHGSRCVQHAEEFIYRFRIPGGFSKYFCVNVIGRRLRVSCQTT